MEFERYLYWYDVVYGFVDYRFNINYNISAASSLVTYIYLWPIGKKTLR